MSPIEKLQPGMKGTASTIVTREVTVAHFHPAMPEVYGTPFMIYLMEVAAANAIQDALPPGWLSVGTHVDVRHLAATPVGREVTATATVLAVDDRSIRFSVEAHDGIERIGVGEHTRAPVELQRFERHVAAKRSVAR